MRTDFGGGSLQSRILSLALRNSAKRVIFAWSMAPSLPWPYAVVDHVGRLQKVALDTTFESVDLPHCRAELISNPGADSGRVIVYFHGGAFVVGGRLLHRALLSRIAEETRSTILAVEYRKLPRHPVSTSVSDGLDAYRYVLDLGYDPADVVFMGDSAGGFLTFTVADAARQARLPQPSCLVAMSPLVDLDLDRTPIDVGRRGCDLFGRRSIPAFARLAARREGGVVPHSPAACEHRSLPPTLLQVSSAESLYSQVCHLAGLLQRAGTPHELQVWDKQIHVFQAARVLPEAQQAIANIATFVDRHAGRLRDARSA